VRELDRKELYELIAEELEISIEDAEEVVVSQFAFLAFIMESGECNKGVRFRGFGAFSPSVYKFVRIMVSKKNIKALLEKWKQTAIDNPDRKIGIKAMDFVRILQTCETLYTYKDSSNTKRKDREGEKVDEGS
jgi:nucleoid DNA-binding protein